MRYAFFVLALPLVAQDPAPARIKGAQPTEYSAFEVATVKVAVPSSGLLSGGSVAPAVRNGIFDGRNVTLRTLLAYAYEVSEVQVFGPDWLGVKRYDVAAKVPDGTPQSEVRRMLQSLLTERFKIVSHSGSRELDALALVVARQGIKLKKLEAGDPYSPEFPKDAPSMLLTTGDMKRWADTLSRSMRRPVIDQTGLQGTYTGAVAYSPMGAGPSDFPDLTTALKEQAGLELVSRKLSVDGIVVDRANEVPEEN